MNTNFEDIINDFLQFSTNTFIEATPESSLKKLEEEIEEVKNELRNTAINTVSLTEEYADCLMCLFDSAFRLGITPHDLRLMMSAKLQANKKRLWIKREDNTYYHQPVTSLSIETESPPYEMPDEIIYNAHD